MPHKRGHTTPKQKRDAVEKSRAFKRKLRDAPAVHRFPTKFPETPDKTLTPQEATRFKLSLEGKGGSIVRDDPKTKALSKESNKQLQTQGFKQQQEQEQAQTAFKEGQIEEEIARQDIQFPAAIPSEFREAQRGRLARSVSLVSPIPGLLESQRRVEEAVPQVLPLGLPGLGLGANLFRSTFGGVTVGSVLGAFGTKSLFTRRASAARTNVEQAKQDMRDANAAVLAGADVSQQAQIFANAEETINLMESHMEMMSSNSFSAFFSGSDEIMIDIERARQPGGELDILKDQFRRNAAISSLGFPPENEQQQQ